MKKLLVILLVFLTLFGCQKNVQPEPQPEPAKAVKVIAPTGAPALNLINYVAEFGKDTVTTTQGPDALQAALLNPESEYDVIIAPINLGTNLILNKGAAYKLAGIVTWGNLYLVENVDLKDSDKEVALFGEAAVPGKIVKSLDLTFKQEVKWYSAVSEVSAALIAGNCSYGILAEPVLTATLAKASQSGVNLAVTSDLQELFNQKYGTNGYPQAALFVSNKAIAEKKADVDELIKQVASVTSADVAKIEGDEEFYGIPSVAVVTKAFDGMNIGYKAATEATNEIAAFLKLFNITDFDAAILK